MITLPEHVVSGAVRRDLPSLVTRVGERPVVVSDPALAGSDAPGGHVASILGAPLVRTRPGEPDASSVFELAERLASGGEDVVVAVGGGSLLDTAKLAARLVDDPGGLASRLMAAAPFPTTGPGVVAVPTTAGSGAEVTRTAVVSEGSRKRWAWDRALLPVGVFLAPELTVGSPPWVTVASGLDALVHAIEAATGRRRIDRVTPLASAVVVSILDALPSVIREPTDIEARRAMQRAATAAGVVIDLCGTGVGHAVGHALGSLVRIPHGLAVMAGMRAALEWTLDTEAERFVPVVPSGDVAGFPDMVDRLLDRVGFQRELSRWPLPSAEALASELAAPDHRPMSENGARPLGPDDRHLVADLTLRRWSG